MKKSKKIALIVAVSLIVSGVITIIGAVVSMGLDFTELNVMKYGLKTHEIQESFENISILVTEYDVKVLPSTTDQCKVVCNDSDKIVHSVSVENNTLIITRQDTRKWYERIGFFLHDNLTVTVYLPEKEYQSLYIKDISGDISVAGGLDFTEAELYSTSGEVSFTGKIKNQFTVKTVSGDISLKDLAEGNMKVTSISGDLLLSDMTLSGLEAKATSGEIKISSVVVNDLAKLETVTGDVKLENSDAVSLEIKTVSGDVKGSLLSPKFFDTHTTSGDVRVPDSDRSAGNCSISTTSGDIKIAVQNLSGS